MDHDQRQLKSEQKTELEAEAVQLNREEHKAVTYLSVEEALQEDAAGTSPPVTVKERLAKSCGEAGISPQSWWKRLFRRRTE